jgi:hypothetical protein
VTGAGGIGAAGGAFEGSVGESDWQANAATSKSAESRWKTILDGFIPCS